VKDKNLLFLGCVGLVALLVIMPIVNGFVLVKLWGWFIVDTFGVVGLTIPHAIGVALIVNLLTMDLRNSNSGDEEKSKAIGQLVGRLLAPFLTLLLGYVVYLFI